MTNQTDQTDQRCSHVLRVTDQLNCAAPSVLHAEGDGRHTIRTVWAIRHPPKDESFRVVTTS